MSKIESRTFKSSPAKASAKVALSSTMVGALFFILTLILTIGPKQFDSFILFQIVLAIPFLFVSILTYSKTAYWKDTFLWDTIGWFSVNIGNGFVLNAVGLMMATSDRVLAFLYFGTLSFLMLLYSIINIYYSNQIVVKLFKYLFFLSILLIGGILPLTIWAP